MSDHVSPLVLDEAAAGLPLDPEAQVHLDTCDTCHAALEAATAARAKVAAMPGAQRTLDALLAKTEAPASAPPKKAAPRWLTIAAVALPLAAGLALFVFSPVTPSSETRLKGAPTVELLDAQGRTVTRAKVGDTLTLAVGGAGLGYAVVLAVDGQGVTTLWPKEGGELGGIAPGARVTLDAFTVTPGNVRLIALFSKEPKRLGLLTTPLVNAVVKRVQARQPVLEVQVPEGLADGVASVTLEVEP